MIEQTNIFTAGNLLVVTQTLCGTTDHIQYGLVMTMNVRFAITNNFSPDHPFVLWYPYRYEGNEPCPDNRNTRYWHAAMYTFGKGGTINSDYNKGDDYVL